MSLTLPTLEICVKKNAMAPHPQLEVEYLSRSSMFSKKTVQLDAGGNELANGDRPQKHLGDENNVSTSTLICPIINITSIANVISLVNRFETT
ncbi:unnamed protein product [Euphydryas editha]|uniref:Uncharacterized protein n=1 Tax=Euphydryas editha TaxID=104508 RepID=A0AAU9ULV6_EUPED|nr:unnamed protein product [Euphydryas editha]